MNRRPSELALVAIALVCVLILAACNCAPTLRYITISPSAPTIVIGGQEAFIATGYYSNGAVTPNISVSWSSSNTTTATINGTSGVATGLVSGTTTITATALGITSGTTLLTVAPATSITVTPATATITLTGTGNTQQFDAVANYAGGSQDVTAVATWAAVNPSVATFSTTTNGLATAAAAGNTQVTATLNGIVGTASLTVTQGTSLVIMPTAVNVPVGGAMALTVMESLPNNTTQPVTGTVTWSSATPAQANVVQYGANGAGIVTGFASTGSGTVTITASEGTLTPATVAVTVDQGTAQFAYVSNATFPDIDIQSYTVTAGAAPYLAPLTTTPGYNGNAPWQTVIDPNGQYLFSTSTGPNNTNVTSYTVNPATGALTQGATVPSFSNSSDTTYAIVDPYGRFLFVADQNAASTTQGGIYVFTINQTSGALTEVAGSPFTSNLNAPAGLAIDQSGTYLFASNSGSTPGTLAAFTVNSTTGVLTPATTPTISASPALNIPELMAWDPTGTYLYVANDGNGSVTSFTLGSNGALTQLTTTPVTNAQALFNLAVSPNGSYLYVLDQGGVSTPNGALYGFTLASGTPSSTPITGSPFAVGNMPMGIAIDPTSSLLLVDDSQSNYINLFTIGSGGVLTAPAQPTVATGAQPQYVTFYNTF